jgi:hypothetical protein
MLNQELRSAMAMEPNPIALQNIIRKKDLPRMRCGVDTCFHPSPTSVDAFAWRCLLGDHVQTVGGAKPRGRAKPLPPQLGGSSAFAE